MPLSIRHRRLVQAVLIVLAAVLVVETVLVLTLPLPGTDLPPRRIILMIGDGMGTGQVAVARDAAPGGTLTLDGLSVGGLAFTGSADNLVTDSAAAATALATGRATNNGMVGVAPDGTLLPTVLERAEEAGFATGLVTTTRLTHATPAAFAAHVVHRSMEDAIADQMVEAGVEVLLGGGRAHFLPASEPGSQRSDEEDLVARAEDLGYRYAETRAGLAASEEADRLLGLFALGHMPFERERDEAVEPSLAEMTERALAILNRDPDGFFLMVEGGRIDHAGHANDLPNTIGETLAFDRAVGLALNFTRATPRTLLVVTADHETGGLAVLPTVPGQPVVVVWTTTGHTGNPVPLHAEGDGAASFGGLNHHVDVGRLLLRLVAGDAVDGAPALQPTLHRPGAERVLPVARWG